MVEGKWGKKWFCLRCVEYHDVKVGKILCPLEAAPMKTPTKEELDAIIKWLREAPTWT
jgi:hypothetical protein